MRSRLACLALMLFVAATPVARAICDVDCAVPQRATPGAAENHCASQDPAPAHPAPVDPCSHDHGADAGVAATAAHHLKPVPLASLPPTGPDVGFTRVRPDVARLSPAAVSPPLLPQTPLRL